MNSKTRIQALREKAISYIVYLSGYSDRRAEIESMVQNARDKAAKSDETKALLNMMDIEAMLEVMDLAERRIRAELHSVLIELRDSVHFDTAPWESRT